MGEATTNVFSQELLLQSPEDTEQFQWTFGGYFESSQLNQSDNEIRFGADDALLGFPFPPGAGNLANNAQTGDLLKYGCNAASFVAQQGFLKWLNPSLGGLIQASSFPLMLILMISSFCLFVNPFLTQKSRRKKV